MVRVSGCEQPRYWGGERASACCGGPSGLRKCSRGCARRQRLPHVVAGDPAGWLSPVGWTAAWVAELAGVVVGHVCVVRGVEDPLVTSLTGAGPDRLGMVSRLFIAPEARGRGLGGLLLTAGSSYASALGL